MREFSNRQAFLAELDNGLRQVYDLGNPMVYDFPAQRARLRIEALDPPIAFDFYTEDMPGRLLVPRLSGALAVRAILPRDEDRKLFHDFLVVEKGQRQFGVPANNVVMPMLAQRFELSHADVPTPAIEEDELSREYAKPRRQLTSRLASKS